MSFECGYESYIKFKTEEAVQQFYDAYNMLPDTIFSISISGDEITGTFEGKGADRYFSDNVYQALDDSNTEDDLLGIVNIGTNGYNPQYHILEGLDIFKRGICSISLDDVSHYNKEDAYTRFFLDTASEFIQEAVEINLMVGKNLAKLEEQFENVYLITSNYNIDIAMVYSKKYERNLEEQIIEYAKVNNIQIHCIDTFVKTKVNFFDPTIEHHQSFIPLNQKQEEVYQQFLQKVNPEKLNKSIDDIKYFMQQKIMDQIKNIKNQKINVPAPFETYENAKKFVNNHIAEEVFSPDDWEYNIQGDRILLTDYIGQEELVVIPGQYGKYKISFALRIRLEYFDYDDVHYIAEGPSFSESTKYLFFKEVNDNKVDIQFIGDYRFSDYLTDCIEGKEIECLNFSEIPVPIVDVTGLKYNFYPFTIFSESENESPQLICGSLLLENFDDNIINDFSKYNILNELSIGLFNGSPIKYLNINQIDLSNVNTVQGMFEDCRLLNNLSELEKWDTSNVESMSSMFKNCESLQELLGLEQWEVSNIKDMQFMFDGCSSLKSLDLSGWKLGKAIREAEIDDSWDNPLIHMFEDCHFEQLILPNDKASAEILIKEIKREINSEKLTIKHLIYRGQEYNLNKEKEA